MGALPGPASRADSARRRLRPGAGVASFVAGGLAVALTAIPIVLALVADGRSPSSTVVFERCEHEDLTATGPDGGPVRHGQCVQRVVRDPVLGEPVDELRLVVRDENGTSNPRGRILTWPLARDAEPEVTFGKDAVTVSDGHVTVAVPPLHSEDVW